jgi:murein endopeptidase
VSYVRNAMWRLALRSATRNFLNNVCPLCLHKGSVKIMRLQVERTVRKCQDQYPVRDRAGFGDQTA